MIATAEQQLETAGGIEDTPFVTITVTIDAADSTKRIVSAYQVLLTFHWFLFQFSCDFCLEHVFILSIAGVLLPVHPQNKSDI